MYQKALMKSILVYRDSLAMSKVINKAESIFTEPNLAELFKVIRQLLGRYNEIPDRDFLELYFQGEKDSKAKECYEALIDDSSIATTSNTLGLMEQQLKHFVKKGSANIAKDFMVKIKLANYSDIKAITEETTDALYQLNKVLDKDMDSEGLMYYDADGSEINEVKQKLLDDYDLRKGGSKGYYKFDTGIQQLDKVIGGIHSVEFLGILGYVKNGKSFLSRQIGYNVLCQGKNVLFVSLEMSFESVQHSFLSLHANNIHYWGYDSVKIRTADIRAGTLSPKAELFFREKVIDDFTTNAEMGSLYIKQPTEAKYTPEKLFADIRDIRNNTMDIDLVIIDYPALMLPSSGHRDRESYNELFREIRHFGLTNHLPIIFVIQANRQGFLNALKDKENLYTPDAIGEYSSIEKEATNVISIITTNEMRESGQSQVQHILSRESALCNPIVLNSDFETGVLSELQSLSAEDSEQLIQEIEI